MSNKMRIVLEVEGPPEQVAMATQMLSAMRDLTVTVGAAPKADAAAPAAAPASGAAADVDTEALLPPVPPRDPPSKLTPLHSDWLHQKAYTITVDTDHHQCVSGGSDSNLEVWREEGRRYTKLLLEGSRQCTSVTHHPGLKLLVANAIVEPGKGGSFLAAWKNKADGDLGYELVGFTQRPAAAKLSVVKALLDIPGFFSAETSAKRTNDILFWQPSEADLRGREEFAALQPAKTFKGHLGVITALAAYPLDPAHKFLSASADGTVKLWDFESGKVLATFGGATSHEGGVTCLDVSGWLAFSGGADKTLKVWDLRDTAAPLATLDLSSSAGAPIQVTANSSQRLAALCSAAGVFIVDYAKEAEPVLKAAEGYDKSRELRDVRWNEEAGILYLASEDGHIDLFSVDY